MGAETAMIAPVGGLRVISLTNLPMTTIALYRRRSRARELAVAAGALQQKIRAGAPAQKPFGGLDLNPGEARFRVHDETDCFGNRHALGPAERRNNLLADILPRDSAGGSGHGTNGADHHIPPAPRGPPDPADTGQS